MAKPDVTAIQRAYARERHEAELRRLAEAEVGDGTPEEVDKVVRRLRASHARARGRVEK